MRTVLRMSTLVLLLLAGSLLLIGCSSSAPPETPQASELDAAIATATQSVSYASGYIYGIKQTMDEPPPSDDLEKVTSTLNLAATQTGAAQRATAQSALDQLDAGIEKTIEAKNAAPQDSATQDQYAELIATLEVGRDALAQALE
jgi:hypothetical protein